MLMSLLYYSRMRFITQLLPLLTASPLPAHVVSVFGPGREAKLYQDDLSLRDPAHFGFMTLGSHAAYFKTMYMEHLAATYPEKLSLCHYYPGLVMTNAFADERLPSWFRVVFKLMTPLLRLFTIPEKEAGERVLFLASERFPARRAAAAGATEDKCAMRSTTSVEGELATAVSTDGTLGGGTYRVNYNLETMASEKVFGKLRKEGFFPKAVKHTERAFEEISAGRKFVD